MTSWDPTQKENTGAPTQPRPTAPPTVAPANDEEIARIEPNIAKTDWQTCSNCDAGLRSINTPPYLIGTHEDYCILTMWPKVIARIEQDRAEVEELKARNADLTRAIEDEASKKFRCENDALRADLAAEKARADRAEELLVEADSLYRSYGLVAGRIEGDPMAAGRWANKVSDLLASAGKEGASR